MGRGDRPLPLTPAQLGRAWHPSRLDGVVIDAAGPWIEIDRDAAPVMALALTRGARGRTRAPAPRPMTGGARCRAADAAPFHPGDGSASPRPAPGPCRGMASERITLDVATGTSRCRARTG
jgi:hypothetical protein